MKRHIAVISRLAAGILVLGTLFLGGCTKAGQENEEENKNTREEYARATLFCDVDFWEPPSWNTEEGTITGDISKKTGLALDITVPVQNADTQFSLMLLNDELPDIISLVDPTAVSQLISSGKVWKMEEFLKTYCPDSHLLKEFPEDIKQELIKRDGDWYAYPSHMNSEDSRIVWKPASKFYEDWNAYSDNNGIIWNKALLEEAGLKAEELNTEEEVMAAWETMKNLNIQVKGEPVIPLLLDGKGYVDPSVKFMEYTFGAERIDEEGNYIDIIRQPQAKHALMYLNKAVLKGYITPEHLTYENAKVKELMASGRVFCFIGNMANAGLDYTEWKSSGPVFSLDGECPVLGKDIRSSTGWLSTFISKECKNPKEIAGWLDYMSSDEGMRLCIYGYEGEDYVLDEEGKVVQTEQGKESALNYRQTGQSAWWMFDNYAWQRSVQADPEPESRQYAEQDMFTAFGKNENTVIYDESVLPITAEEFPEGATEMRKLDVKIQALEKEGIMQILLSESQEEAEDEYEEMIEKLEEAEIKQLDSYKNILYEQRCEKYGSRIEKVNHEKKTAD